MRKKIGGPGAFRDHHQRLVERAQRGAWALLVFPLLSCDPALVVGEWACLAGGGSRATSANEFPTPTAAHEVPFESGFENGFCDFEGEAGFCYANVAADYQIVSDPVHSGAFAASFEITGQATDGLQARCARQGELPRAAYYGAWFLIPQAVVSAYNWNLFHFEGREADDPQPGPQHGLWDVSLGLRSDGTLFPYVYDFLTPTLHMIDGVDIPLNQWFHLEVYWERAEGPTGIFQLYVDGELALELADRATDDSTLGQWYLGNLAAAISPSPNVLFVDDVTLSTVRQGGP